MKAEPVLAAAILESHVGILGKTGSGKSNLAKTIVEGLLDDGARVCVIDPTGTWYGLRLTRDRKPSPYQVVMFGGNHADIAIGRTHGAAVAEAIGTTTTPAVIDTRTMTVGERTEFFTAFAETLLQRNRGPLHLVIDEAHLFAPQGRVNDPKSGAMVHAANNLVSLGRGIGLRIILISQRPAKLHKDSLTQVETLVTLRLIAPQDRRAVEDWIGEWADPKQGAALVASLPSLRTGEAWIWSPEAGVLERRQTPLARTLDTGKPSGEPIELAPIDIAAMQGRLDEVAAEVLANDPAQLRKRIRELEAASATVTPPAAERIVEKFVKVPVLNGQVDDLRAAALSLIGVAEQIASVGSSITAAIDRVAAAPRPAQQSTPVDASRQASAGRIAAPPAERGTPVSRPAVEVSPRSPAEPTSTDYGDVKLDAGARRMLTALAWFHPTPLTRLQLGTLVDLPAKGSTYRSYLSKIRTYGLLEEPGGQLALSPAGAELMAGELGSGEPTTQELVAMWSQRFDRGARLMLEALVDRHPDGLTREELAAVVEIPAAGSTFRSYLSKIRTNQLLEEADGVLRASAALFITAGR
jgi:hypothetical protein